jgi:signal transduction histidine kinase
MQWNLDGLGHNGATPDLKRRVEQLKSLTADVGQEVNRLAWEIRPTTLDDLGLQTAFQQFIEECGQSSNLQFDLHLALSDRRLPPIIETTLYRILQEAITNVAKHAEAKKVGVILEATVDEAILIVEDDGKGFRSDETAENVAPSARLGLLGMRERLALVGGTLEIEANPGFGTTLIIHVPLR